MKNKIQTILKPQPLVARFGFRLGADSKTVQQVRQEAATKYKFESRNEN